MTHTTDRLRAIFDQVCDPEDWKGPIAVRCKGEAVTTICEAIKHFTATMPTVRLDTSRMKYLVESVGYRAGPAGDH